MLDIIAEVKAEAERELLLAKAKIEVAESIETKFLERQSDESQKTFDIAPNDELEVEPDGESELGNI
jgi:hypothetical protein